MRENSAAIQPRDLLFELLQPSRLTAVVDIGANPIDGDPPYKGMLGKGLCTIVGFEPQESALALLNQRKGPRETYLPYAVGDGAPCTLHVCRAPGMTSLLKPDVHMLSLFHLFSDFGAVVSEELVATRRLDEIVEIDALDFLKIDVQGSELQVFRAGRQKLAHAVAIHTEVSFLPLYENQPLFGEIDQELRSQGFVPHAFADMKRWAIAPLVVNGNPRQALNQLLEADIVYVRDFSRPDGLTDEQLKHLTLIAHHCYGSFDLALKCLLLLKQRGTLGKGEEQRYLRLLEAEVISPKRNA